MTFLLDENLPFALIDAIERLDHTVHHIKKLGKSGIVNGEVYQLSIELRSWIITRDKDFLNLEKFYRYSVAGIIVIVSSKDLTVKELIETIAIFFDHHLDLCSIKRLITIEDGVVRTLE